MTDGFSGSDIANICREAIMAPIRDLDSGDLINDTTIKARAVTEGDYITALDNVNKSVSGNELVRFREWDEEFGAG